MMKNDNSTLLRVYNDHLCKYSLTDNLGLDGQGIVKAPWQSAGDPEGRLQIRNNFSIRRKLPSISWNMHQLHPALDPDEPENVLGNQKSE